MKRILPAIFLLATQLIANVPAQQPTPTPAPAPQKPVPTSDAEDVVRITTNLVQVDAVITDSKGRIVTDLKPEEIEIFEDGRQQKITHFSYNVAEGGAPSTENRTRSNEADKNAVRLPPTRLRPEEVRRTIALVVDDLGLSFESTHYVRRALKKFVDEQMQPGDLVAIVRTSSGMGALQQFTADKRQLYAAIERVRFYLNGRTGIGAFAPIQPPTPGALGQVVDDANAELDQFRQELYSVGTLGAVSYVVKGLRDLPGRKSLLLISEGFRINDPTRNYRALQKLQRLIDDAGRASVVIYTMNAAGLQTLGISAEDDLSGREWEQVEDALTARRNQAFRTQEGLDYLARETGGLAIKNTNDLARGIRRVMEDQKGYYLVGYRPDQSTFTARMGRRPFHHLTLKVKRPGKFNVRMRRGFFGISDDEQQKPRTMAEQLVGALISPFGSTGVHLQLTSLFANDPKLGSIMRSLLHADARDLTFTKEQNGMHQCVFDLLAITFGDNGAPIDQIGKTYTIQLTDSQYQRVLHEGLVYYVTVPIKKAGAYQLRMSLRDTITERIGSASQFIETPDIKKNRLALSGLVVRGENRGAKAGVLTSTKSEGVEEGGAEASPAVRHFTRGMVMTYAYFIYNARVDKNSPKPQLVTQVRLFRDGKEVFVGKENSFESSGQTDLKRLAVSGAIQLGSDMTPGEYVLQVVVSDLLADQKHRIATQWMDFQIVK